MCYKIWWNRAVRRDKSRRVESDGTEGYGQEVHEYEASGGGSGRHLHCWLTSFSRSLKTLLHINFDGIFYGTVILLLAFYAVAWQQVIRVLPLTTAFANKAVTTAWGLVWGLLFFQEQITFGKLLGVTLVIAGVVLFSTAEQEA